MKRISTTLMATPWAHLRPNTVPLGCSCHHVGDQEQHGGRENRGSRAWSWPYFLDARSALGDPPNVPSGQPAMQPALSTRCARAACPGESCSLLALRSRHPAANFLSPSRRAGASHVCPLCFPRHPVPTCSLAAPRTVALLCLLRLRARRARAARGFSRAPAHVCVRVRCWHTV
jgi:hypothetical protein